MEKDSEKKLSWNEIKSNIKDLWRKEFHFNRYDELSGKQLFTKDIDNEVNSKYPNVIVSNNVKNEIDNYTKEVEKKYKQEYRGVSLWIKEVVESSLALLLIVFFVVLTFCFFINFAFNHPFDFTVEGYGFLADSFSTFAFSILKIAGAVLILDSILLIAALISSPGIDETIDSISVTIAGVLLLILGKYEKIVETPELILKVILPLTLLVIALIITKHFLRHFRATSIIKQHDNKNMGKRKKRKKIK